MVLNNCRYQPVVLFKCNLHRPAFPKLVLKTKNPLGFSAPAGQ
jgi:hypothetical protein